MSHRWHDGSDFTTTTGSETAAFDTRRDRKADWDGCARSVPNFLKRKYNMSQSFDSRDQGILTLSMPLKKSGSFRLRQIVLFMSIMTF
jgi:hypothetical protein